MVFLFRSGTVRDKARLILKATRQHARNLAMYASLYKLVLYALRTLRPAGRNKELRYDTFVAGLVGGYVVFGRGYQSSVNQQISIYVFARVVLALAKMMVMGRGRREAGTGAAAATAGGGGERSWAAGRTEARTRGLLAQNAWPVFASLSWAFVMYIFRWYPEMLQPSLRSSMKYMYVCLVSAILSFVLATVCFLPLTFPCF